jgi:hypothetical protein
LLPQLVTLTAGAGGGAMGQSFRNGTKLATAIGVKTLRHLGYESRLAFIEEKNAWLLKPT